MTSLILSGRKGHGRPFGPRYHRSVRPPVRLAPPAPASWAAGQRIGSPIGPLVVGEHRTTTLIDLHDPQTGHVCAELVCMFGEWRFVHRANRVFFGDPVALRTRGIGYPKMASARLMQTLRIGLARWRAGRKGAAK